MHVKGDLTRSMKPGDHVVITGVYLPQPVLRRGRMFATTLLQTTVIHATDVQQLKESYAEHVVTEQVLHSTPTSVSCQNKLLPLRRAAKLYSLLHTLL